MLQPCPAYQEGLGNFYNRQSSLCFHTSPYLNPDMWPSSPSCPELLQLPHLQSLQRPRASRAGPPLPTAAGCHLPGSHTEAAVPHVILPAYLQVPPARSGIGELPFQVAPCEARGREAHLARRADQAPHRESAPPQQSAELGLRGALWAGQQVEGDAEGGAAGRDVHGERVGPRVALPLHRNNRRRGETRGRSADAARGRSGGPEETGLQGGQNALPFLQRGSEEGRGNTPTRGEGRWPRSSGFVVLLGRGANARSWAFLGRGAVWLAPAARDGDVHGEGVGGPPLDLQQQGPSGKERHGAGAGRAWGNKRQRSQGGA